jgi:hypothetical protein
MMERGQASIDVLLSMAMLIVAILILSTGLAKVTFAVSYTQKQLKNHAEETGCMIYFQAIRNMGASTIENLPSLCIKHSTTIIISDGKHAYINVPNHYLER